MCVNRSTQLVAVVLYGLLLAVFIAQLSIYTANQQLLSELEEKLAAKINEASINHIPSLSTEKFTTFLANRINRDLSTIQPLGPSIIQSCQALVIDINGKTFSHKVNFTNIHQFHWLITGQPQSLSLGLTCHIQKPALFILTGLVSTLTMILLSVVSRPLTGKRKTLVTKLRREGLKPKQAYTLTSSLKRYTADQWLVFEQVFEPTNISLIDSIRFLNRGYLRELNMEQIAWLTLGLKHYAGDLYAAAIVAKSPNRLMFCLDNHSITLHGIEIKLSTTPFFYYLWYACRRCQSETTEGWTINPPSNRADKVAAAELIQLMEQFDGHNKAINDLNSKGLRSKTLDQNRSKLKEELLQVLDETLIHEYLFDVQRDAQTARFKYRLALPASHLQAHYRGRLISLAALTTAYQTSLPTSKKLA